MKCENCENVTDSRLAVKRFCTKCYLDMLSKTEKSYETQFNAWISHCVLDEATLKKARGVIEAAFLMGWQSGLRLHD